MLEPLATTGADSGAKPWLAKNWYPNTTFDRWVINLQTGVKFQDGEPFNADAVVGRTSTPTARAHCPAWPSGRCSKASRPSPRPASRWT